MASSYNGSTGGFEPFGGSSILSLAAILTLRAVALGGQGFAPVLEGTVRADDNYVPLLQKRVMKI